MKVERGGMTPLHSFVVIVAIFLRFDPLQNNRQFIAPLSLTPLKLTMLFLGYTENLGRSIFQPDRHEPGVVGSSLDGEPVELRQSQPDVSTGQGGRKDSA